MKAAKKAKCTSDAATDVPRKPINVLEIGGGKAITQRAKATLLRELQDLRYLPPDLACSARKMLRLREEVATRNTPFGPLKIEREFQTEDGPKNYPMQNPLAMLYVAMSEGGRFSWYVRKAFAAFGMPSLAVPWSIVVYVDEVTCGNPLAVRGDAKRKVQGVYWTLHQLGAQAMADETCWFELAAFRTSESGAFIGSVSHLLDVCMTCFFDPHGTNMRYGSLFDLKEHGKFMLFLVVEGLIADIKAIVEAIGANGVSAILPCFLCRRILSFKAKQKDTLAGLVDFRDLSCLDEHLWGKHTNASLTKLLNDLEVASDTLTGAELKRKQTLSGYKHMPNNFLRNQYTVPRPIDCIILDWMHLVFQSADWNREMYGCLTAGTTRATHAYQLLQPYVDAYDFPHATQSVKSLLCDKHWEACKTAEMFKATASDGLTLFAVCSKFFDDVLLPRHVGHASHAGLQARVTSYHKLADCIDLLQVCKHGMDICPDLLEGKVMEWRVANQAAYGNNLTYLKTHLTQHLPDIIRKRSASISGNRTLIACWALDRGLMRWCMCMH
jgi:hypothetical protein